MTVEGIELRKILTQMLADNDINRETIKSFVKEIVNEKVDKAINQVMHERNIIYLVNNTVNELTRTIVKDEIANKVRKTLNCTSITIECREFTKAIEKDHKLMENHGGTIC
jgi:ribosomal protein S3AE